MPQTLTVEDKLDILNEKLQLLLEIQGNPYHDERGRISVQAGSFEVFHGKGVIKVGIILPQRDDSGFVSKAGAVLIEAAPVTGQRRQDGLPEYDWTRKVTFSLNATDIGQLIDPSKDGDVFLTHKDQRKTPPEIHKTLSFKPPTGNYNTHNLYIEDKLKGIQVFVPFTPGQYIQFQRLLLVALPIIIGWPR
jgi:hypothetical protein